jgi:putative ABC transport system permease protein
MSNLLSQIWTVVTMNVLSLPRRLWTSLAAVFAVAVVVAVLLSFLAMANGFETTLRSAGSDATAIVTSSRSESEWSSDLSRDVINILATAPGIAKDDVGEPIYSAELYVVVDGIKRSTQSATNLPLRGLSRAGFELRDRVDLIKGRLFEPGRNEIIVGKGILGEFDGFELGQPVRFGKSEWTVVGVFSTGGSAFESELWADATSVQDQFRRGSTFNTMRIKLAEPGDVQPLVKFAKNDPRLRVDIETESDFFAAQGRALGTIVYFGWALSIIMALGVMAGALNTMYTSVASRSAQIATLRAIGFSGFSAFVGTLAESVVLSIVGGIVGALCAYIFMDGITTSTLGASFTQVVFSLELSPSLLRNGVYLALAIGLVGGIFPAWRAARLPVRLAFR